MIPWEYSVLAVLPLAAAILASFGYYVYRRSDAPGALLLSSLLLVMAVWDLAYALELAAADLAAKLFWAKVKFAAALVLPPLWLSFCLGYTGRAGWHDRRRVGLLVALSVLPAAIVWATGAHAVVWRSVRLDTAGALVTLDARLGFWFWAALACSYGLLLLGTASLVSNLAGHHVLFRKQSAVLIMATLLPWAANGLSLAELSPLPRLDLTPFALPLTAALIALGISRCRLLDIVPSDRDEVLSGMADGVIVLDRRDRVVDLNPAAESILGTTRSKAVGHNISQLSLGRAGLTAGHRAADLFERYRREGRAYTEVQLAEASTQRSFALVLSPLGNGRREGRVLVLHDITERKLAEERLQRLAHHDPLTALPNRTLLYDRLEQAITRARRTKTKVALLFLDLDRFKHINDTMGHDVGDLLLKEVAERLVGCVKETDTVARLAGDEFVVLLTDISEAHDVSKLAGRINEALSDTYEVESHRFSTSVSTGVVMYPADGQDAATLLERADSAMYRAKWLGGSRFEFYRAEMSARIGAQATMGDLKLALQGDQFDVYYQPIVSLGDGKVFGIEALGRWRYPERGLLSPMHFIAAAEETGMIVPIGLSMLRKACAQASRWREWRPSDQPLTMCVNLSARQLGHPDLVRDVAGILQEAGLEPDNLMLEVSENTLMEDARAASTIMRELKAVGVKLAIDDFGTGYTSLPYLKRLPVDFLKIDRSLIRGLEEEPERVTIAAATVSLAHTLGLRVIAEGVETPGQLSHLGGLGCDLIQGHYLAEAASAAKAAGMISFIERYYY